MIFLVLFLKIVQISFTWFIKLLLIEHARESKKILLTDFDVLSW